MSKRIGPKEAAARQLRERPRSKRKEVIGRSPSELHKATRPATVAAPGAVSQHNHTAETLAPPGVCAYCDRRRAGAAASMRKSRKRAAKEGTPA